MTQPFTLVIFGVTSNLAQKYLLPALYDLEDKGLLPDGSHIIGIARSPQKEGWIQEHLHQILHKENLHHKHEIKDQIKELLFTRLHYLDGHLDNPDFYQKLKIKLDGLNSQNIIFYLATYPDLYQPIFENLKLSGLSNLADGFVRLMIEKPFGSNLKTAKQLNKTLHQYFKEEQIYRLDHYLGKEALRDILSFRFGSSSVESIINKDHIDHIQVSATENFGVGERGAFYDKVGALKDVGQNHLLQMLTAATMEKPITFTNEEVTKERVKILKKLLPQKENIIFGQYEDYTAEKNISPDSLTETFFALKTFINNDRYQNVPIYLRAGKKLAQTLTEVMIVFKDKKNQPLRYHVHSQRDNFLVQDPYEALILDAIRGDQTYFNDVQEVEAQWAFTDPLSAESEKGIPVIYQPGSWGPQEADELIEQDGRHWINF